MIKKILPVTIAILIVFNGISTAKTITIENEREPEFEATGFIHVEKDENGIWWFVNSTGHKFYFTRLTNEYYYCRFRLKHQSFVNGKGWNHDRTPDVFDPWWQNLTWNATQKYAKPLRNDPDLLGYYMDNEMKWGPDTSDNLTMLDVYMDAGENTSGKKRLISFLKDRYKDNTSLFNLVWNMNITDFNDLFSHRKLGIKDAWRLNSKIKFFNQQIKREFKNKSLFRLAKADLRNFTRLVAEKYFNFTDTALKAADPNHLNLGVRFHLLGVPREVLNESGKYCDVISINYYRSKEISRIAHDYTIKKFGNVPLNFWMKKYYQITGKPLFVGEYGFLKKDRIFPLELFDYDPYIRTEYARANMFEWYVRNCFKSPYMVGHHWFGDNLGDPNGPLYKRLIDLNSRANELHEKASLNSICSVEDYSSYDLLITHLFKNEQQESANSYPTYKSTLLTQYVPAEWKYDHNVKNYGITIYVDDIPGDEGPDNPPEDYTCIQDAIDNASMGDKIFVYNGTYHEKITINKSNLIIEGENEINTILEKFYEDFIFRGLDFQKPNNYVINVMADNITISGFNITTKKSGIYMGSSGCLRACQGISITDANSCTIINNTFSSLSYGIDVIDGSNTKIFNNHNGFEVKLEYANDSEIRNNDLTEIRILKSNNCTIKNNYIPGGKIVFEESHNNLISDNTIFETGNRGIFLASSNNNHITFNNFIKKDFKTDVYYESATFLNSYNNKWDHNYWSRSRIFPKIIVGRRGKEGFIPTVNFDWHPASEPYEI